MDNLVKVIFFSLLVLGCDKNRMVKELRLGHGLDVNHSVHKAMVKMSQDLDSISDGRLKLEIYPNSQLGTERECLELLQIGSLDMTKVSVGVLENFSPKMKLFGLPYLFKSKEHAYKVLDSPLGMEMLSDLEDYWLKGLCYYDAGSRSFYTKEKPIVSPSDLEGKKIRVMESGTAIRMVNSLGGSPTPIAWGELYTSLQQGVVDGAENNLPSFFLSKHYEVCKFYSLNEHTILPDVLVASSSTWNKLNELEKEWIGKAVVLSVQYQRELWSLSEKHALESVKKAGVKIVRPDKEDFVTKTKKIRDEYQTNPEFGDLLRKIMESE